MSPTSQTSCIVCNDSNYCNNVLDMILTILIGFEAFYKVSCNYTMTAHHAFVHMVINVIHVFEIIRSVIYNIHYVSLSCHILEKNVFIRNLMSSAS